MTGSLKEMRENDDIRDILKDYKVTKFVPFNPVDKKTIATVTRSDGSQFLASKGAPGVMQVLKYNSTKRLNYFDVIEVML